MNAEHIAGLRKWLDNRRTEFRESCRGMAVEEKWVVEDWYFIDLLALLDEKVASMRPPGTLGYHDVDEFYPEDEKEKQIKAGATGKKNAEIGVTVVDGESK